MLYRFWAIFFFFLVRLYNSQCRLLAFSTTSFHLLLSWTKVFQFGSFNLCISFLTPSSQRIFGLPVGLFEMCFQVCIALTILVSCILSMWPYLLTPWCRVLLEKLTGLQLVKKFPTFYGTRSFITAHTSLRLPVSILGQPNPVHIPISHLLEIHPNIIHPSTPRSPKWSLSLRFPHQNPIHPLSSPIRATCLAHLILLECITHTILGEDYKSFSSSLCNLLQSPVTSSLLGPNILLNTMFSNTLSFLSSRNVSNQVSHPYKTRS